MPRGRKAAPVLAAALVALAQAGEQTENVSAGILQSIAARKLHTIETFDQAIAEAYQANGWHTAAGRPMADTDRRAVPHTVRTYVWEIRSAYRVGVEVWKFPTLNALRMARRKHREKTGAATVAAIDSQGTAHVPAVIPAEVVQDFDGVKIAAVQTVNGALFHDLMVCFLHLKAEDRTLFGRQLARLLHSWQPKLPAPVAQAPAEVAGEVPARRRGRPAAVEARA